MTPKATAAWEQIKNNGETWVKYHGAGGAILKDGTRIHSHIIKSLCAAGLLRRVTFNPQTGEAIDGVRGWHFQICEGALASLRKAMK